MRNDDRIVGHADEASDGGEYGELVHPESCCFSSGRNIQLGRDKPQAEGFAQYQNEESEDEVDEDDVPKGNLQVFQIPFAQGERDKTGGCSGKRAGEKSEERDDAGHDIVDTEIFQAVFRPRKNALAFAGKRLCVLLET